MRIQLFEFEDLSWFPDAIRKGGTDYLRYFLKATSFYKPVIPLLHAALQQSGESSVLDLCSGGGGNIEYIYHGLSAYRNEKVPVVLTDKFPNLNAYGYLKKSSDGGISFESDPVDATQVPAHLKGFRTVFSAAHHFAPENIKGMLKNAVEANAGIAIFDGGDKNIFTILGIMLFHPLAFAVCTPFFRPFRFSRLVFTYLLPLIPITTVWDGVVSILRLYKPWELLAMAESASEGTAYTWKAGKVKNSLGMRVTYLVGYPEKKKE